MIGFNPKTLDRMQLATFMAHSIHAADSAGHHLATQSATVPPRLAPLTGRTRRLLPRYATRTVRVKRVNPPYRVNPKPRAAPGPGGCEAKASLPLRFRLASALPPLPLRFAS